MKRGYRAFVALAVVFALAGCSSFSLEKLRNAVPQGSAFQKALAARYLAFSDSEAKDYDWISSWHFADKGLLAVYGHDVDPEDLKHWDIPAQNLPEMQKAREALIAALNPGNRNARPEAAANALFSFDCWVEQQDEDWQPADIALCRDHYYAAMHRLTGAARPEGTEITPAEPIATMAAPAPEEPPLVMSTSYIVLFKPGAAELTAEGMASVRDVAKDLAQADNYEVILRRDSEAPEAAKGLADERAAAVKSTLIAQGVKENAITRQDEEGDVLAEQSASGTPPAQSTKQPGRRVEIFLNE